MNPVIEKIGLQESENSFHFFKLEVNQFKPFWHYHPELELTLITEGHGTRFIGNSILPYTKNDLVLIGANLPHNYSSVHHQQDQQGAIVLQFPSHIFNSFKECELLHNLYQEAERGIHFIKPTIRTLKMLQNFESVPKTEQVAVLLQVLHQLYEHKDRKYLSSPSYFYQRVSAKSQGKIKTITTYILENLNKKLTVKEMAERTSMVEQSFCRWFKKAVGHSFVTFLNTSRIEQACMFLLTSDKPIQAIAYDCGFESLSHFNRTFKKLKGKSPREFRA
ncbi:AraC family transcriptional regulator [Maribacter sp. ACAM166]|uniref:AraC family transcriptional regulator n=1 Tax=Maribacter sp. ACAM166 TaxID=2508996 RepID=UPI0010FE0D87|nr:AraC family transcriptional regulator [Maribacter sp. ACAM166]TLP79166.1 helix-turn-helix domain-containing protein [Maribacter sp. ACAM166]